MFTPITQNTIKYTYQLYAKSTLTNRLHTINTDKLLATVHTDGYTIVCDSEKEVLK